MWAPVIVGTLATAAAVPVYWLLNDSLGVEGLALASSVAITLYTAALAVLWYRRTGGEYARPVFATSLRTASGAAIGGIAAFFIARLVAEQLDAGWPADLIAVALGGAVAVALTLAPPWVRRDLRS